MTRDEAKLILQGHRPEGIDAQDPFFAEALVEVARDPELRAWWEAQREFDRRVTAKVGDVPVPDYLRDAILAQRNVVPFSPARKYWVSAALAAAIIGLIVLNYAVISSLEPMKRSVYTAEVLPYVEHDPAFDLTAEEQAKVVAWLKDHHSPTGPLPPGMGGLSSIGCEKLDVQGHRVSLICFHLAKGGEAHLFIVRRTALSDPPGASPEFAQTGDWSTAAWTTDGMSFVLATKSGPEALKALL